MRSFNLIALQDLRTLARSIRHFSENRFVRNVVVVALGTAGSQAIAMAFSPLLTRLYGPEAFGALGTFTAILAIATPISALTFPIAIILPKSDSDASGLAALSALVGLLTAALTAFAYIWLGESVATLLHIVGMQEMLLLVPIAMIFSAFHQILSQWLMRHQEFSITARATFLQSLVTNSAKAGYGLYNPVAGPLIVFTTLSHALNAALLYVGAVRRGFSLPARDWKFARLWTLAKRHRDFPLFRAPQVTINALSQSLPVFMLASCFGPASAGFYSLGRSVMGVPSTLLAKSVADVFYPRITKAAHQNADLGGMISKATLSLALVGLLPFGFVAMFGPSVFSTVFGAEWEGAGTFARWLAPWLYVAFINRPSVAAIATLGLQDFFLGYEAASIALRAGALYVGYSMFGSDVASVVLFSLSGVLLNAFLIFFTLYRSRVPRTK